MSEHNVQGKALSWQVAEGVLELALHREPCNEIGSVTLEELERFTAAMEAAGDAAHVVILHSTLNCGFSAGADLRELYRRSQEVPEAERLSGVRAFLERIHRVMNALDGSPLPVIAVVHGVCFGGGFELALTSDLIIADRTARFCFPELRLGLIPGFGGVRLKRDLGNAVVRDLLLTGRSINATKAQAVGLVSQVVAEGQALSVARTTANQLKKFDPHTVATAKQFVKPIPHEDLRREIDIFCQLFTRPAVQEALRKFVESKDALPYLP
jgi:enoyl-CoA hydratase/carnithine racemase